MIHWHHIIPIHAGGIDDPSNLKPMTIPEHAEEHRKLFEQFGRKGDLLAWKALSGQIGKEEIQKEKTALGVAATVLRQTGKKQSPETIEKRAKKLRGKKRTRETILLMSKVMMGRVLTARDWILISPTGEEIKVHNLQEFCKVNGLWSNAMTLVSQGKRPHHRQWTCKKVPK